MNISSNLTNRKGKRLMFKKKEALPVTADEKIIAVQARVAQSIDVFKKAEEDVAAAQEELTAIIQAAKKEIENQAEIIKKADAEYEYNKKIHAKLVAFRGE